MPHLAKIAREYKDENGHRAKLLFLMPCHSTPYFSHIHENVTMRFLTCEPNFNQQSNYVDEADYFYKDPLTWYRSHIPVYPKTAMPTHLIMFDNLVEKLPEILVDYQQIHNVDHAEVSVQFCFFLLYVRLVRSRYSHGFAFHHVIQRKRRQRAMVS